MINKYIQLQSMNETLYQSKEFTPSYNVRNYQDGNGQIGNNKSTTVNNNFPKPFMLSFNYLPNNHTDINISLSLLSAHALSISYCLHLHSARLFTSHRVSSLIWPNAERFFLHFRDNLTRRRLLQRRASSWKRREDHF